MAGDIDFVGEFGHRFVFNSLVVEVGEVGVAVLVSDGFHAFNRSVGELGEDILQGVLAGVAYGDVDTLRFTAYFEVAQVDRLRIDGNVGGIDGNAAHGECVLVARRSGEGDVAAEVTGLGGTEGNVHRRSGAGSDCIGALRYIELVGRRCHVVAVETAPTPLEVAVADVDQLHFESLGLTHEEVAEVDELGACEFGMIACDIDHHVGRSARRLCFVGSGFEAIGVCAVDEFLTVGGESDCLRLTGTHFTRCGIGIERGTPIGILADGVHIPCHAVGTRSECRFCKDDVELCPCGAVVATVEAVLRHIHIIEHKTGTEGIGLAGGELDNHPEARTRSEAYLLVEGDVGAVVEVVVVHSLEQCGSRDGARALIYFYCGVLAVVAAEADVRQVESVGICILVHIEVLRHGIGQLGIGLADVGEEILGVSEGCRPFIGIVFGRYNRTLTYRHGVDVTGERHEATRHGFAVDAVGRHICGIDCRSRQRVFEHAFTGVGDVERALADCRLRGVDADVDAAGAECGHRAGIGCGGLHGRHSRGLAPTVVGNECYIILCIGTKTREFVRRVVTAVVELGVGRGTAQRAEVGRCVEGRCAVIYHVVVDGAVAACGDGPLDEDIVVRSGQCKVADGFGSVAFITLESFVGIDVARAHQAFIRRIDRSGEERTESFVGEVLVAVLGEDERGDARHVGARHRSTFVVAVSAVGKGTENAVLLSVVHQAAGGGDVDPRAVVGV